MVLTLSLIGIGCGDPAYLTREALGAINAADLILIPRKGEEKSELAALRRRICGDVLTNAKTRLVEFDLPVRDSEDADYRAGVDAWHDAVAATWSRAIGTHLGKEGRVALLIWGDPSLYDSSLRIAPGPNPRMAWLDKGEAYFRIQHDSARPFVLMVQGRRLVDLGTEFLVKAEPKRLEVALVAGRAQLDSPNDPTQEPAVLTPGDVAIATANAISVTAKSTKALSDELSWRQGVLVFKYTTLADAAAEFNRYNYKKIVIADPKIAQLTIVGTFPSNDVSAFTDAAQAIFGLKIRNTDGEIDITR